jgi:hypothetical protein
MQAPAERKTRPCGSQPALTTALLTGTTLILEGQPCVSCLGLRQRCFGRRCSRL